MSEAVANLSPEQRKQALMIAASLERDFGESVFLAFAAGDECSIDRHVVMTGISLAALMLAAHLHAGNETSFLDMAKQALALSRTGGTVQ